MRLRFNYGGAFWTRLKFILLVVASSIIFTGISLTNF